MTSARQMFVLRKRTAALPTQPRHPGFVPSASRMESAEREAVPPVKPKKRK
jgi:hypothetical protein